MTSLGLPNGVLSVDEAWEQILVARPRLAKMGKGKFEMVYRRLLAKESPMATFRAISIDCGVNRGGVSNIAYSFHLRSAVKRRQPKRRVKRPDYLPDAVEAYSQWRIYRPRTRLSQEVFTPVYALLIDFEQPKTRTAIVQQCHVGIRTVDAIIDCFRIRTAENDQSIALQACSASLLENAEPEIVSLIVRLLRGETVVVGNRGCGRPIAGFGLSFKAIAQAVGVDKKVVARINRDYRARSAKRVQQVANRCNHRQPILSIRKIVALCKKKNQTTGRFVFTEEEIADLAGTSAWFISRLCKKKAIRRSDPRLMPTRIQLHGAGVSPALRIFAATNPRKFRLRQLILRQFQLTLHGSQRILDDTIKQLSITDPHRINEVERYIRNLSHRHQVFLPSASENRDRAARQEFADTWNTSPSQKKGRHPTLEEVVARLNRRLVPKPIAYRWHQAFFVEPPRRSDKCPEAPPIDWERWVASALYADRD